MERWYQYQTIYKPLKRLTEVVDSLMYKLEHNITGKSYAGFSLVFKALWCLYQWIFMGQKNASRLTLDRSSFFSPRSVLDEDDMLLKKLSNPRITCTKKKEIFHEIYPSSFWLFAENCCYYDEYSNNFINGNDTNRHWNFEMQPIYTNVTAECDEWLEGVQYCIDSFFENMNNWDTDDEYVVTPQNLAVYKDKLAIGLEDYLGDAASAIVEAMFLQDPEYFYTVTNGNVAIYNEINAYDFYGRMLHSLFTFDNYGDLDSSLFQLLKNGYLCAMLTNFNHLETVSDELLVQLMYQTRGDIVYFNAMQYQEACLEYLVFQSTAVAYLLHVDINTVPISYRDMVQWWKEEVLRIETPLVPYRIEKHTNNSLSHSIAVVSDENTYLVSGYVSTFQGEFQEWVNRYCPDLRNLCLLEMADYLYDILHAEKE